MHSKLEYEYAVIRLVPQVEREEFMNIGLLLMCKSRRFIKVAYTLDCDRIACFAPYLDTSAIEIQLPAFIAIAYGEPGSGLIGTLTVHERFRWLTAKRSTIIQTSSVHGGITDDLEESFERLYKDYIRLPEIKQEHKDKPIL